MSPQSLLSPTRTLALMLSAATLALGVGACQQAATNNAAAAAAAPHSASGLQLGWIDKSVKPGDDWYQYGNGGFLKSTQIPADRSSVGAFYIADQKREADTKALFDKILSGSPAAGSNDAKIKDYYNAYLNTDAIDKAGLAPAKADLDAIAAISDKTALARAIGASLRAELDPLNNVNFDTDHLFGFFISQGLNTPGEQLPYILQGGLGMPSPEYYSSADPKMAGIRAKYHDYVQTLMQAAGNPDPKGAADRILALETKIAAGSETPEQMNDYAHSATIWTRDQLKQNAPGLDWDALLAAAQMGSVNKFQAYSAPSIPKIAALVGSEPLDSWKDWMTFHQLNEFASVLPKPIRDASFAFHGQALNGIPQQRPRDALALNATSSALEDAVGKAYTDAYFPASSKADIQKMVTEIKAAFAKRVQALDWMAPSTKAEAIKKVEGIIVGVGYPDKWRDYSSLSISPTDPYANAKAVSAYNYKDQLAKIGKPMDRGEWWMPAQLVNAVNLPVQNALNFPAAILQPPFYVAGADPAYNYGAIGAVIGHEISHSFDNGGAAFDATGNMRNWWTPADFAHFEQSSAALAAQYDAYSPFPGIHVNGKQTLAENIADVAGLSAAYQAYHDSLGGKPAATVDGYTGDQIFFLAFDQTWVGKMRDEVMRRIIATNGHSPDIYRALTVRNVDGWYNAFNVKPGEKLYLAPDKRVKVW
ncbi:M13 family metallopeptidase [Sphingomonas sp. ASV193]|uniref:M13 family metallopeptidase n=1 Tax=Sphingomonas sp. ASV193 TaxID=3144405 RepID=UPI0032E8E532